MAYQPGLIPQDVAALQTFLQDELSAIADALKDGAVKNVEFLHVAPVKVREGLIAGADGTDWNPGAGKGVYCYYSSAWNKLG